MSGGGPRFTKRYNAALSLDIMRSAPTTRTHRPSARCNDPLEGRSDDHTAGGREWPPDPTP
jgi:hypothetical protein